MQEQGAFFSTRTSNTQLHGTADVAAISDAFSSCRLCSGSGGGFRVPGTAATAVVAGFRGEQGVGNRELGVGADGGVWLSVVLSSPVLSTEYSVLGAVGGPSAAGAALSHPTTSAARSSTRWRAPASSAASAAAWPA